MRGGKVLLTRCGCHSYRCGACASGLFVLMQRNYEADRDTESGPTEDAGATVAKGARILQEL